MDGKSRNFISRVKCFFGFHQWLDWKEQWYSEGYYDQERWYERKCACCGTTEECSDAEGIPTALR